MASSHTSTEGVISAVLTLLTILLSIAPFVWHVKNRNLAASSLIFWIVLLNTFYFINALIWPNDDMDNWWRGYGLCDIEIKLQLAVTIGIPTSLVCVMRSLARVLNTNRTVLQPTPAQRRRRYAVEILLCFGVPVYMIIVHYVVQNVRYYIFAISGCVPGFDDSWPSTVLVHMWPPFFSVIAVYYGIIVVIRMHKYRREFAAIICASSSGLTKSRFLRLFFMSLTLIILGLPVQFYVLYKNTSSYTLVPYSWNRVHGPAWWDIILIPTDGTVTFDHWIQLAVGFAVFVFFGMGHDMKKMYRNWLLKIGFGRLFPSLDRSRQETDREGSDSQTGSHTSRARLFFQRKFSRGSRSTSSTASITRSSFTASPSQAHRPSLPLDVINEKPPLAAKDDQPARPRRSLITRWLETAHISGPYSAFRALSPFGRPPRGVGLSHQRPPTQVAESGRQCTDQMDFTGPGPLSEKQEV